MTKSQNKVIQDILNLIVTDNDINKEGKYNGYYILVVIKLLIAIQ